MRAVIPVAGFGTRLKPHTYSLPKVLLNVGGKAILGHILDKLLDDGIHKATFVVGYLGDMIQKYVQDNYPSIKSDFVVQEEMLGLGHAIYTAVPTFDDDEIFIILGDTVFDVDIKSVLEVKKTALGVKEVADPSRFGVAVMKDGAIERLVEKPKEPISKLALVGLYYIRNQKLLVESLNELIEKDIRTKGELQLTDALQIMIDKGEKVTTFPVEGWYDCGKPETLLSTNRYLLDKNGTNRKVENVVINHPVFIAETATVKNSVLGPYATISDDCVIEDSIVKNSIISSGAKVYKSMLSDSIIGSNAVIKGNYKKLNAGDSSEIEFY
ncbi:MAG: NTP transferase domain-containing protein [Melioribacteraceae bacterium]|nr:NTP transferase domain-containing protein [Melioribacteraceae bacterium]MCF8354746.1 NTP transferase domain-containing protein [Melioribacteraceae bacterium]MCF8393232.1 NTP transferase domain-containing protein [Melioribacteraceae bacterium]MCF8417533.1 NTP transferase domain-containing protein [Melioribacteraceae bacterium]